MGLDYETIKTQMPVLVPMVGTLNIEYLEVAPGRAVLRMADQQPFHNHIGGLHAGAMFALAETASGAIVLAGFGDKLGEYLPLPTTATITFLKMARGDLTANATMARTVEEIIAEAESGTRPEFDVEVEIEDPQGTVTGKMSIRWTLKKIRPE